MPDGVLYVPCGDRRASRLPTLRRDLPRRHLPAHPRRPRRRQRRPRPPSPATRPCSPPSPPPPSGPSTPGIVNRRTGKVAPCRMRRDLTRCPHGTPLDLHRTATPRTHPSPGPADLPGLLRPRPPRRLERLGRRTLAPHHHHPHPRCSSPSNAPTASSCGSPTARSPSTSAAASCTSTPSSASTRSTPPTRMPILAPPAGHHRRRPGRARRRRRHHHRVPDPGLRRHHPLLAHRAGAPSSTSAPSPARRATAPRMSPPRPSPPTWPSTPPRPPNPPGCRSPAG